MTAGLGHAENLPRPPVLAGATGYTEAHRADPPVASTRAPNDQTAGEHEVIEPPADVRALHDVWSHKPGFYGWLTSTNHKDIGLRFVSTAFFFFALAGLLALAMRTQLALPENGVLGPDLYNQFFTTHGSAMMFLFAVPVMEGMGIYLVPLMVGSRTIAFPRLTAFAYWTYLCAGLLLFGGLALNVGPDMGWFSYVPLAGPEYSPGKRVDVWSQMVTIVEIASMSGAVSMIVTILKLRAPGMSLNRIPLFCWAMLVTSFMVLFAMPAVTLSSTVLSMDRLTNVSTHVFNPAEGGDSLLWQHLFWFFGHPDVYIFFLPANGFISSIVPTFARRKVFGYTAIVLSMIATGFIGFGVWVHHMFTTPLPDLGQGMFTASSMMIVIPTGVQIFCWLATLWTSRLRLSVPLTFVFGFFAIFILGGLTGVILAAVSIDLQVHDTHFVVAHLHYVLIGGAVFPLLGAIYYWFPKWTGRMLGARLGYLGFWLLFIGFNATFYPLHHLGTHGMTRRVYTYLPDTGWGPMNLLGTVGAYTMGLGVLTFVVNVFLSRRSGVRTGANPWDGGTLEWAAASPVPSYNFAHPPTCQGRDPVWDNRPDAAVVVGLSEEKREVLCTTVLDAAPDHRYAVAGNSLWPIAAAASVALAFIGGMFHPAVALIACAPFTLVMFAWFWASGKERLGKPGSPD